MFDLPDDIPVGKLWRLVQQRFEEEGLNPAPSEGKKLVQHVLGWDDVKMVNEDSTPCSAREIGVISHLAACRLSGEPLAYVIGKAEFFGHDWQVREGVLIPRPDTEVLVNAVLSRLPEGPCKVAEVGVGSGAVIGSILLENEQVSAIGTDISDVAIEVTLANLTRFGVHNRCVLMQTDLLDGAGKGFDVILSNPPYIADAEWLELEDSVRDFEPPEALLAGDDGMEIYERLIPQAAAKLVNGGWLALEIGWQQAEAVRSLLQQEPWQDIQTLQDLAGRDRCVVARKRD